MVATPAQTDTYSTALDIFDRTHPLRVDIDENLKVVLSAGSINQGAPGPSPWPVVENPSSSAVVSSVSVTTMSTILLTANANRKGLIIQCKDAPLYVILGTEASTDLYSYYLLKLNALELDNYTGFLAAITDTGTATVLVTEKF